MSSTRTTSANAVVTRLVSQIPTSVLAASADPLRLTWQVSTSNQGLRQQAYEVQAADSDAFEAVLATTGVVDSDDQVAVPAPGAPLESREVRHYRVRIRTDIGWSDWSSTLRIEAGLLRSSDWTADRDHDPRRPRSSSAGAATTAAKGIRGTGACTSGQAVRHGARGLSDGDQRSPCLRGHPRSGMDRLSRSPPRRGLRRDRLASHRSQRHHGCGGRRLVPRSPRLGSRRWPGPLRHGCGLVRTTRSRPG